MNNHKKTEMRGMVIVGAGTGAATIMQRGRDAVFGAPWSGTLLLGVIGLIGIGFLLSKRTRFRSWIVILSAFAADTFLTTLFHWLSEGSHEYNPLALWPYVLGTASTFLVAIGVGLIRPQAPLVHCWGFASCGLLLASLVQLWHPLPLTFTLASRIVAMYGAAIIGGVIGKHWHEIAKESCPILERMKKFFARTLADVVPAIVGGIVVLLFQVYILKVR
jgi:hypothetical protein